MKSIKFEVYINGDLFGYERIGEHGNWEWMTPSLNPEGKERWTPGVIQFDNINTRFDNVDIQRRQVLPVEEIISLIKESFDENIFSDAYTTLDGLDSCVQGKEEFYADLQKKLTNL